jgi:WD40 repeat protein
VDAVGLGEWDGETRVLYATNGYTGSGEIKIWDVETLVVLQTIPVQERMSSLLFHQDQRTLVSYSYYDPDVVSLWDVQTGQLSHRFDLGGIRGQYLALSPDGLSVAFFSRITSADFRVSEFNLQTALLKNTRYSFTFYMDTAPPFSYTADGDLLVLSYARDNKLHLLDLTNNTDLVLPFPFSDLEEMVMAFANIEAMAISLDGKYVAGGGVNGTIYIWDKSTRTLMHQIDAHEIQITDGWMGGIRIMEFSPNSYLLVSVGYDGVVQLWDAKSGRLLRQLLSTCNHIGSCYAGFTPDGRYLVTAGDGVIRVWGLP